MSHSLRRLALPIAAVVAILALGMATPARADLELWVSTTGPATAANLVESAPSGGTTPTYSATLGAFSINSLTTSSNSSGDPSGSFLVGTGLTLTNTSGSTATLWITIGDTGFKTPFAPPGTVNVSSSIGGSVTRGGAANAIQFQSYINTNNAQNGTSGGLGSQNSPQAGFVVTSVGSYNNTITPSLSALKAPYSITETFKITLSSGGKLGFNSSTVLSNPTLASVPEPSSLAIAGIGGLGLIGYGLRRRKSVGA